MIVSTTVQCKLQTDEDPLVEDLFSSSSSSLLLCLWLSFLILQVMLMIVSTTVQCKLQMEEDPLVEDWGN